MKRMKGFLRNRGFIAGCMTVAIALLITCTMMIQGAAQVQASTAVEAGTSKVSTKTTKKTTKKNVKMKKAATKSYTRRLPATKKKSTKTTKGNSTVVKTETSVLTQVTEKYTKKSKVKVVNTNVVTTVVTTTTTVDNPVENFQSGNSSENVVKPSDNQQAAANKSFKYTVSAAAAAPKVDSRVISAYNRLGFSIQVDSTAAYTGHYDTKTRMITLREEDDSVYHELGHFLAFAAGNADKSAGFNNVYAQEKSKYAGANKVYATQNSSEYFAESLKDYTLNPAALRSSRPMTYSAIEEALNKLTDAQINKLLQVYGPIWK